MARILICEDDELYRQIAEVAFAGSGHELTFAEDGNSALAQMRKQHIDLLVTDLVMPDKDGLEIIRDIRGAGSSTPILAISGGRTSQRDPLLAAATALGANRIVLKPFRPHVLREQAEALLAGIPATPSDIQA